MKSKNETCFFIQSITNATDYATKYKDVMKVDMWVGIVLSTPLLLSTAYCLYVAYRHHWK